MSNPPPRTRAERLQDIFEQVSALPLDQRSSSLNTHCAGDDALRSEVESLLAADEHAGGFLADPTIEAKRFDPTTASGDRPEELRQIGPYKLLQTVGEGGFGTVYLAEQQEPLRRRVALKVIKLGMDTRQVVARFEAERQALAMMDHPNIARVFDAGATETGRPYFVMELVNGIPITQYCDANRLTAHQRLELFIPVCLAVQHAHQKGVIHRDIKPNNVLVTLHDGRPVPKVIDFGVAKATQARLTEKTLFTELRTMIGTPEYMSPEQAEMSGLDVDTRSDVYSLGVLMYELLTGATPFDARVLRGKAFAEMQRVIREVDPPRPSTRLSTIGTIASIAAQRGVEPKKLHALIRGELDWIVMKCLEKDRSRRYDSASSLANDVKNYLADETVLASPPGKAYRLRKLVRRHKLGISAAVTVVLAMGIGLVFAVYGFTQARKQRDLAVAARNDAIAARNDAIAARDAEAEARSYESETDSFLKKMFDSIDPAQSRGKDVLVRDVLDSASKRIEINPPKHPIAEASLRYFFGVAFLRIGLLDRAAHELERALELERRVRGKDAIEIAHVLSELAAIYHQRGQADLAEVANRESLEIHRTALGPENPNTLIAQTNLAVVLVDRNKLDEADTLLTGVLNYDLVHGSEPKDIIQVQNTLAALRSRRGRHAEAAELLRAAAQLSIRTNGADDPTTLALQNNLADNLRTLGKLDEAVVLGAQTLQAAVRVQGPNHPTTLRFANNQSLCLYALGRLDESGALYVDTIARMKATLGEENPRTLLTRNNAVLVLLAQDRFDEALAESRDVAARLHKISGDDNPNTLIADSQVAWTLAKMGRYPEAESLLRGQIMLARKVFGDRHANTLVILMRTGFTLTQQGKTGEAEPLLLEAYNGAKSTGILAAQPQIILNYGLCLAREKKSQQALTVLLESEQAFSKSNAPDASVGTRQAIDGLIEVYGQLGNGAEADRWRQRREATATAPSTTHPTSAPTAR